MNMLTYFLKGKTQYQLHSPFVFNMYNEVLLPKVNVSAIHTRNLSRNDRRNAAIIFKIADYYGIKAIAFERNTLGNDFAHWLECDLSQLSKTEVVEYMGGGVGENTILLCGADAFFKFKEQTDSHFPHSSIVVVPNVHKTKEKERQWLEIQNDKSNILILDLYTMGVVFYRKELSEERYTLLI